MICAACGALRDPDDLIAFWPVGEPGLRRFVCRVTRPSSVHATEASCFRLVVEGSAVHSIGPATPVATEAGPEMVQVSA